MDFGPRNIALRATDPASYCAFLCGPISGHPVLRCSMALARDNGILEFRGTAARASERALGIHDNFLTLIYPSYAPRVSARVC
jgi:hypothetical protein